MKWIRALLQYLSVRNSFCPWPGYPHSIQVKRRDADRVKYRIRFISKNGKVL